MLINSLALREEDKKVSEARVKSMLATYKSGKIDKNGIDKYFSEWTEVSTRLKKGAELIDEGAAVRDGSKQYVKELEDLYVLLLKLLGMYDELFKKVFSGRPEYHQRAQRAILDILME